MQKLRLVTVTGADDEVDPRALAEICRIAERANFVTYIDENGAPVSDQNQGAST